jgi:hypothetical protein
MNPLTADETAASSGTAVVARFLTSFATYESGHRDARGRAEGGRSARAACPGLVIIVTSSYVVDTTGRRDGAVGPRRRR